MLDYDVISHVKSGAETGFSWSQFLLRKEAIRVDEFAAAMVELAVMGGKSKTIKMLC